ncbi:MAG: beta-carotene 15,15'-monooxygenase [Solibacillus sp.]
MFIIEKLKPIWLILIFGIIISNFMLYQTTMGAAILPEQSQYVVLGSMLDLIIILPLSIMLYRNNFSVKTTIVLAALGCIAARFLIPTSLLEPYEAITWIGIIIEGFIFLFELLLIITFVRYMPKIIKEVKQSQLPVLFSFAQSLARYVKNNLIIQIICAELLMFYYALASWRSPMPNGITMYKKSNFIALQVMLIHAIIVETLGVHYWLHDKAPLLSIILLVLNIYSILFFLGDMQALRLNPIYATNNSIYISLGLMKRTEINYTNIEAIIEEPEILQKKLSKNTVDFIIRDFEKVYPDIILKMKKPQKVTLFMGREKEFDFVAIKSDHPEQLKQLIEVNTMK